jgi:hypothetical protein
VAEVNDDTWLEFLGPLGVESCCGLCGNSGILDTRGAVHSPAGEDCGVRACVLHLPQRPDDQAAHGRRPAARRSSSMTSVITDWNAREDELPDVAPGDEHERLYRSQMFIVLMRVIVLDMVLARLQVGSVEVPFALESTKNAKRTYTLAGLDDDDDDLRRRLIEAGARVATKDSIAIMPGIDVRVVLRNDGSTPTKPRVALIVQEEIGR